MNTLQQPSWAEKLSTVGVVVLCLFGFGLQLFAFNKGFDITDEGYNIQLMRSRFVGTSNTYFFEVYRLLFGWLPYKIWVFRLVSAVLLVVSNGLLVTGAFRYFKIPFKPLYVAAALLGIPLSVSLDPVTFSYNFATAVFALASVGSFLYAASVTRFKQKILWLCSGILVSMVLVCKITSGLALFTGLVGLIFFSGSERWKALAWFTGGWVVYQLIHMVCATPFWIQLHRILDAAPIFQQMDANYSSTQMLNVAWTFTRAQLELVFIFGIGWVGYRYVQGRWKIIPLLAVTAYVWYLFDTSDYKLTAHIAVLFVTYCVSMAGVLHTQWKTITLLQVRETLTMVLLWSIPLAVSLGTNNHYNYNYMFASSPLLVLGITMIHRNRMQLQSFGPVLILFMCMAVTHVCYTKILFQPYRILPLPEQTQEGSFPVLSGIKLDEATVHRFSHLKQTMEKNGFAPGNPVVCLGKMQGVLSVLETSTPGGVMFSPVFKELYLHNLQSDTLTYTLPYFLLSDAPITNEASMFQQDHWGERFNEILSHKLNQEVQWKLLDSVPFENTPMGQLFVYRMF